MTEPRFSIDDGSLDACDSVGHIADWLAAHASFVDHRTGTVSLHHIRAALRHAYEFGTQAASREGADV